MENLDIEKISLHISKIIENLGFSQDQILILGIFFILIIEKNTDFILLLVLFLLFID